MYKKRLYIQSGNKGFQYDYDVGLLKLEKKLFFFDDIKFLGISKLKKLKCLFIHVMSRDGVLFWSFSFEKLNLNDKEFRVLTMQRPYFNR